MSFASKSGWPLSSQSSHSSRPTSALGASSHPKLSNTSPSTPPIIIASSSSHPLLTTDLADSFGKRDGIVKYDDYSDVDHNDGANLEVCRT